MCPYRGQVHDEDEDALFEEFWQKLAERVCPIPNGLMGVGTPGRYFHEDLQFLTAMDLELDKARARFRACLERDRPNLRWLLERVERIEDEQARRAETAWPPLEAAEAPPRPMPVPRRETAREDVERQLEAMQHGEWLRWQAEQAGQAAGEAVQRRGRLTVLRGGADVSAGEGA